MSTTTAPETSGVKVSVATITNGVVSTTLIPVGHLDSINTLMEQTRNVQKYTPINNTQFDEIVGMGSISQAAMNMTVLYDPEATDGINSIYSAFTSNSTIQIIIELNNAKTGPGKGTTYKQIIKVSGWKLPIEKDGRLKADFTAEKIGLPTVVAAS